MSNPTVIHTSKVSGLEFVETVDILRPGQWAIWLVRFTLNGKRFRGDLQAGVVEPECFCHDEIEYIEELDID
jgi:hypothetical protein